MTVEQVFSICNTAALMCWVALVIGPRWPVVSATIRWGVITGMSLLYAVLIAVFFFRVEGGGFLSLAEVQTLLADRHIALAGWIHFLAFDLFVGLWIAARADAMALHRIIQAPILLAAFMFGPLGFLLFQAVRLGASAMGKANTAPEGASS